MTNHTDSRPPIIDRGDAVNLAHSIVRHEGTPDVPVTLRGVRVLADAVLLMDQGIRTLERKNADLRQSMDFYQRRCVLLQKWQSQMRDPERTIVCDILANGCTLNPPRDRYAIPDADLRAELAAALADKAVQHGMLLQAREHAEASEQRESEARRMANIYRDFYYRALSSIGSFDVALQTYIAEQLSTAIRAHRRRSAAGHYRRKAVSDVICKHYRMSRSCPHCAADDAPLLRYPQQAEQNAAPATVDYEYCHECRTSFSFAKPRTDDGRCPQCGYSLCPSSLPAPSAPAAPDRDALVKRLRSLKVLLGTDSPEVRGWAPAVQQNAQKTINAAISALTPAADSVVVPREIVRAAMDELRLNKLYEYSPAMWRLYDLLTAASAKEPKK